MPGMNSGLNVNDPAVVAAFKTALLHQGLIALLIFALLGLAWVTVRAWAWPGRGSAGPRRPGAWPSLRGGRLLRIGFGVLWIFDGILQAQPKMAVGLPSQVIQPTAASSPALGAARGELGRDDLVVSPDAGRRRRGVDPGRHRHLAAGRRPRLAVPARPGWPASRWGLVVWVFGESFGGIFAPGLTWLFGAPGAAALYVRGRAR